MARERSWMLAGLVVALSCGGRQETSENDGGSAGSQSAGSGGSGGGGGSLLVGGSAGVPSDGSAFGCADFGRSEECSACLEDRCCSEVRTCASREDCLGLVACARECPTEMGTPDSSCLQSCLDESPDAFEGYNAVLLCQATECVNECPFGTP